MIPDWIIYILAGLFVVSWFYLWGARRRIEELEIAMFNMRETRNKVLEDQVKLQKRIDILAEKLEKSLEEHKGTMQVCSSALTNSIRKIEKQIDILEKSESCKPEPVDVDYMLWHETVESSPEEDKIVSYQWIFPSKEQWQCVPVTGQRYLVVGILHGRETLEDGSPFICTEEAVWDQYKFVTDNGNRFEKTYAYIRKPDSSDIMNDVVGIVLEGK